MRSQLLRLFKSKRIVPQHPTHAQRQNSNVLFIKNGGEPAYSNAATYKVSIKSCSLIANICLEKNEENCEKNLTECVQQAADLQDTQECWRAISQARLSLEDSKSNRQRVRRDVVAEGTTTTTGVLWDSTTKPPSTHPTSREHLGSRDPFTFNFF
ncbi:hypothetical protein COOONC_20286, partial [Cooperia oncophora]